VAVTQANDTERRVGFRERVLINKEFSWLWGASVVTALGDWVGFFAITALAANISGAPEAATALVLTARVAPSFFLAPFMGVLVDRFDRKLMMRIADVGRALVFVTLPFVNTLWGLILASLVLEAFTLLWSPAKEALVPAIVPKNRLTTANSLSVLAAYGTLPFAGIIQFLLEKGNQALAGFSWLEPLQFGRSIGKTQALAFYFDAATFLLTAFIVWRFIKTPGAPGAASAPPDDRFFDSQSSPESTGPESLVSESEPAESIGAEEASHDPVAKEPARGFKATLAEIREGWRYIFVNPVVRAVNLGLAAGLLGGAMLVPLGPTFAKKVTGDVNAFSLYVTALGLGVAIAVAILNVVQSRIPKPGVFVAMLFFAGLSLLFAVTMSTFWFSVIGVFGLGLGAGSVYVLGFTLLQENTDDELRGRIFTTLLTLVRLCVLGAMVLGPALSALIDPIANEVFADGARDGIPGVTVFNQYYALPGVRFTLWIAAIVILIAAVVASRAMKVGFRENLRGISDEVRSMREESREVPVVVDEDEPGPMLQRTDSDDQMPRG